MTAHLIQQIENYVKSIVGNQGAHDFKHSDRVKNWALKIAKKEHFQDLELIQVSALMHDIGLSKCPKPSMHGEVGAKMTEKFLLKNNLLTPPKIAEICQAIKYHNTNRQGQGELLNILRDADMLDLFGAVGIKRAFTSKATKAEYNYTNIKSDTWNMRAKDFDQFFDNGIGVGNFIIDQINFQISCYDNLKTKTAKQLAKPLIKFMKNFIMQLELEINQGKKLTRYHSTPKSKFK